MSTHALSSVQAVTTPGLDDPTLASLTKKQESLARFSTFTTESAWEIGSTIRSTFLAETKYSQGSPDTGIVIHIELFNGHVLFSNAVGRTPAVSPDNWAWVRGKFNVVKRFGISSLRMGRELAAKGKTPADRFLAFPDYACHGGGFPIWLASSDISPIGAIVVSGLPQLSDHQLIVDSLAKLPHLLSA